MPPFGPPRIHGVTDRSAEDSPLDGMMKRMTAKPKASVPLVREAIDLLRKAIRIDPRIEDVVGPALALLTRGESGDEDDDEEEMGRDGRPHAHRTDHRDGGADRRY